MLGCTGEGHGRIRGPDLSWGSGSLLFRTPKWGLREALPPELGVVFRYEKKEVFV